MRQHRTYSITQSYAYTPGKDILQRPQIPMTTRRASRFVSFVLGLALGTVVAILLSLLSAWFFPLTPAPTRSVRSADQAQVWTLSARAVGKPDLSWALLENPFARL
jgi:hypothetical protein